MIFELMEKVSLNFKIFYLIKHVIELKLFDYLVDYKTPDEIAKILNMDEVVVEYILKILRELNLLESYVKNGKTMFRNTEIANTYLRSNSKRSLCNALNFYFEKIALWENLNKNKNFGKESFFPTVVKRMAEECKAWELERVTNYIASYEEFKNAKKLLDLGGGHGLYSIKFSELNKNLKCYVFDLPTVVEVTKKYIKQYGANNVFTISGDFFKDDIGKGYDIVFSSYNPGGKNPKVIKKVYDSLNCGGLFINKQSFPLEEKDVGDLINNLEWNLWKLEDKDKFRYTFKGDLNYYEYLNYLEEIGFKIIEIVKLKDLLGYDFSNTKMIIAKK